MINFFRHIYESSGPGTYGSSNDAKRLVVRPSIISGLNCIIILLLLLLYTTAGAQRPSAPFEVSTKAPLSCTEQ